MTSLHLRSTAFVCALFSGYLALFMIIPALLDMARGNSEWQVFAASALLVGGLAASVGLATYSRSPLPTSSRFGFLLVNALWVTTALGGAIPFMGAPTHLSFTDAVFESISALTTTGSTVVSGLDELPPGILFWRSLLQWIGGIGVIALGLFILPLLKVGGVDYLRIESSDTGERPFDRLATYTKALRSRNRLLKQDPIDPRSVRSYDAILADAGAVIGRARASLVTSLAPRVAQAFHDVAGVELPLDVSYRPRVAPERETLLRTLEQAFEKDCARGFTADGPHADDLALTVRAIAAKHHASQGQQRAIVLALKVAELDELSARTGKVPVLLLDDVSSELDRGRNRRLFELLSRLGGQVFLSTTHPEFILLEEHRRDFHVARGVVTPSGG